MKNETIKKYENALEELELRCKMNAKVTNYIISEHHNVGNSFVSYAKRIGYVKPKGKGYYDWCAGNKSKSVLAENLLDFTNARVRESQKRMRLEQKEQPKAQPKRKVKPVKTETTSWFWGLYTKTVKG